MKLSILNTLGLMALLATTVSSSITKTAQAQAQTQPQPPSFTDEEIAVFAVACERATQENTEVTPDGGRLYDTLRAMNVTDQQRNAYDTLNEQAEAKRLEIYNNSVSVPNPAAIIGFMSPGSYNYFWCTA